MNMHRLGTMVVILATIGFVGSVPCHAGSFNFTFAAKGTSATMGVGFGAGNANLETYTGVTSDGHSFSGQAVGQYGAGTTACSFTAFGNSETGTSLTLIGGSAITIEPGVGKLFVQAASGTGCISVSSGDFSINQTDTIVGGGGSYAGAGGTETDTIVGHDVGNPTSGTFNFEKTSATLSITTP